MESKKYTFCLAMICNNNETNILDTLNNIYKYIDYWVICDTGSNDKTVEIIEKFFKEKDITGEMYIDEWKSGEYNKTLLFNRCYKKTDFFIYLNTKYILKNEIPLQELDIEKIGYDINIKNNSIINKKILIFNNHYKWKAFGITNTLNVCINNYSNLLKGNFKNEITIINLKNNLYDNIDYSSILKEQFFDTLINDNNNLNSYYAFYTANKYFEFNNYNEACNWYSLYSRLKNIQNEILYECYNKIIICMIKMNYCIDKIILTARKGIELFDDRAEIYFILSDYFLKFEKYDLAFFNIIKASECNFKDVCKKYNLFIDENCYFEKNIFLICFLSLKTGNIEYGKKILNNFPNIDNDEKNKIIELFKTNK